jgi:transmembrane protein 17
LGYLGNLQERVPELTGFWLLTLIIQTPLCVFLLAIVWIPIEQNGFQIVYQIPMQFALQLIHFLFVVFEDIFGFISVRVLARYQIARFHYKQFDPNQNLGNVEKNNDFRELDWLQNLGRMNETGFKVCFIFDY